MRVKAVTSFVATIGGVKYRVQAGDELEMPQGADWLGAGFVAAVEEKPAPAPKRSSKKKASDG